MRHRLTVRALSCAAACILTAACGTLLSVEPVEGVSPDGGDSSAGDAAAVDGAAADGAQQLGNLVLDLAPRELVLYAGQAATFEVRVTRPPGDTTTLDLSPVLLPAGLTASPPLLRLSQGETVATFSLVAAADATPHRLSFDMRAAAHSAAAPIALPLTVLLSRAYRTATTATGIVVAPTTDQTYKVLAWGAGGGGGGAGAFVTGAITVAAGNTILVAVGQGGSLASSPGTPGGGAGGLGVNIQVSGGGGGGYSGVFLGTTISFARAWLVAGAGGGGSSSAGTDILGGSGGAPGEAGRGVGPGAPATPTSGGAGGGTGEAGIALTGGNGQPGDGSLNHAGGGGGGGYYGGGGGALESGGGGGSCLVPANGTAAGGSGQQPGNSTAPERNGAGAPDKAGAVILIPQ